MPACLAVVPAHGAAGAEGGRQQAPQMLLCNVGLPRQRRNLIALGLPYTLTLAEGAARRGRTRTRLHT